jgi:hypothetical protein
VRNLLFDELCIKRAKKSFLIFSAVCTALVSVIYTPIYFLLSSNVLWRGSVLLFVLTEFIEPLIDFSFYWGSFAFLIYMYLRFERRNIKHFAIIYGAAAALRYLLTMFVGFLVMSFPDGEAFWSEEVPSAIFSIGMDLLQAVGVLILAEFVCLRPMLSAKNYSKGAEREELITDCFPIANFFNFKTPICKLCFFSSLIPSGLKLISRIYYDIEWGMPTDISEWLLMATYYVADFASIVIGHLVLLYLLQLFYTEETKKQIAFES